MFITAIGGTRRILPVAAFLVAAGCATNPVTGRSEIALISESQEIQMGQQAAQEAAQSIGLVQDQALQDYVQRIGSRLAAGSERPNLPWTFRVADDPTPNAFALPGGYIFVTRGLLTLMRSEAELASVLGHEIGHVTARHSVQMLSRQQLAQIGLGVGMVLLPQLQNFGQLAGTGLSLLFLRYSRDAERQADDLGFRYALQERYDMRQMANVFVALERSEQLGGQSPLPSWLASHPNPGNRAQAAQQRAAQIENPGTLNTGEAEYMARLQGMIYGSNPRHGFFAQNIFHHPELRFSVTLPQGWRYQNLAQAVVAGSSQQDAVIQLTLAQGAHTAAADAFLRQQGLQVGQLSQQTINGNPAVVATFAANTEQGQIQGLGAWISYGSRTYQLLGFSASARYAQYDAAFRGTLGSFRPLTDQSILGIQPNRVSVVTLERASTLADFNRQFPSRIPVEELAIINQVESQTTPLPAGMRIKRVVRD
jgi:predicted Zn-dependent protease